VALAKRAAGERGKAGSARAAGMEGVKGDKATVWQAWQAVQDSPCASATGALLPSPWPWQSGAGWNAGDSEEWPEWLSMPAGL
jgi:hypothetical protein